MPYYEHELQLKFVQWFQQYGYHEVANDAQTNKGSSMDSVGFIGNRPILIEFKHRIDQNSVLHVSEQGGTIEQKIARGLKCLYGERNESITVPLAEWDKKTTPHLYLVANHISEDARHRLKGLLQVRSREWWFNYTVYVWQDGQPIKIAEEVVTTPHLAAGERPAIPDLLHLPRLRQRSRSLEEFRELAESNGVLVLFEAMSLCIGRLDGIATKNRQNINFRFPHYNSESQFSVVGIWPAHSSRTLGLLVSYSLPEVGKCFSVSPEIEAKLPGQSITRRGHLGQSRYLRTVEEVYQFWRLITGDKSG